ncbi:MAG: hypothetical protein WA035_07300 [Trichococcus flocculiformis]
MHVTKKRPSASDGRFFVAVVRFFTVIGQTASLFVALVRFFAVIGQEMIQSACGCPILSGYRTSSGPVGIWLSDSFRLSDKQ